MQQLSVSQLCSMSAKVIRSSSVLLKEGFSSFRQQRVFLFFTSAQSLTAKQKKRLLTPEGISPVLSFAPV